MTHDSDRDDAMKKNSVGRNSNGLAKKHLCPDEDSNRARHPGTDPNSDLLKRVSRNIGWYIDSFPGLLQREKAAVRLIVRDRPELASRLAEARELDALLRDAGAITDINRDPETGWYAVTATTGTDKGTGPLQTALSRLLRRLNLNGHPALDVLESEFTDELDPQPGQADRLDVGSSDESATRHFEAITGHRVEEPFIEYEARTRYSHLGPVEAGLTRVRDSVTEVSSRALTSRGFHAAVRSAGVAFIVMTMLHVVSYYNDSPRERMAHIRDADTEWIEAGIQRRGTMLNRQKVVFDQYYIAHGLIQEAHKSVFGLFPSYNPELLAEARDVMQSAMDYQYEYSPPHAEVYLLYAKLSYLLGDMEGARSALMKAQIQNNPAADESARFLLLFP